MCYGKYLRKTRVNGVIPKAEIGQIGHQTVSYTEAVPKSGLVMNDPQDNGWI